MSIYYHFYSAVEQSALRALVRIYDWAMKQYVTPLFITDYIDRVLDFNKVSLAKGLITDSWVISNNGTLREFRWPVDYGEPDLVLSKNIAGFNIVNNQYYIHLGSAPETVLKFTKSPQTKPYLVDANGILSFWKLVNEHTIQFHLKSYVPLQFKLAHMEKCQVSMNNQFIQPNADNIYAIQGVNSATLEIQCA